jgi:hypothetical protein
MTSGYPDWLRAFLLLGQHEGDYLPVLLGADGSLYAVLQGDYLGSPMPIKIDEDGQLYMYITDIPDQFGNKSNIGIGELAARIVGWPVSYDRRGQVQFYECFDHGWGTFRSTLGGGATAALYPSSALQGGYCARLATPAVGGSYASLYSGFPLAVPTTALGLGCFLAPLDQYDFLTLKINYLSSPVAYYAGVKMTKADKKIWLQTGEDDWTEVGAWIPSTLSYYSWYYLKFAVDLATQKYKRIILQGDELDVSTVALFTTTTTASSLNLQAVLYGVAAGVGSCLLDCITLTTQEP